MAATCHTDTCIPHVQSLTLVPGKGRSPPSDTDVAELQEAVEGGTCVHVCSMMETSTCGVDLQEVHTCVYEQAIYRSAAPGGTLSGILVYSTGLRCTWDAWGSHVHRGYILCYVCCVCSR